MAGAADGTAGTRAADRLRLWDWPVRVVHWSIVLLLPALWWTWKADRMAWHERLGYLALALIVFRLIWGLIGGQTARFAGFVKGPRGIVRYLRDLFARRAEPAVGHNPLGGWSVLALLALLAGQLVTGLFTQDTDGLESGPLTPLVSYDTAEAARGWHGLLFDALLAMVALHVAAILFYWLVKRDNLVGPMISGRRRWPAPLPVITYAPPWRAPAALLVAGGFAWWVSLGAPL